MNLTREQAALVLERDKLIRWIENASEISELAALEKKLKNINERLGIGGEYEERG